MDVVNLMSYICRNLISSLLWHLHVSFFLALFIRYEDNKLRFGFTFSPFRPISIVIYSSVLGADCATSTVVTQGSPTSDF